jgi:hypothetical protein
MRISPELRHKATDCHVLFSHVYISYMHRMCRIGVCRMASSEMLRCVALVITDVSEELSTSYISVTRIGELGITLAVTSNRRTQRRNIK